MEQLIMNLILILSAFLWQGDGYAENPCDPGDIYWYNGYWLGDGRPATECIPFR